ncbi:MAG: asparagine synthase (glutamine-hydrolyzing) [Bacteroidota bacterium]|nr:asparagine synthase (glutamine-hydrolyzing) [Bacteroidota bacterium]
MVKEMCTIMKHGGPDDEGIYADEEQHVVLGHRRLSLIDLSASGHQPMGYAEGRYQISFNGEIYNYRELKAELIKAGYPFKTGSDTEVILAAFAAWGTEAFAKLNGMFAFALWDHVNARCYLVRDASGIKPLYYAATSEGLAFSSEIKGFRPIPYLQEENEVWPVYLMAYGHLPEPVTVLKKVQPLQKGSFLCYDAHSGKSRTEPFRQFHFAETISNKREAIFLLKESLQKSVQRHLISDAPIGVFLSGGLDSGIIALLANADQQTRLNTLSLFFEEDEFSEKKYQDLLLQNMFCKRNQHLLKEEEFHEHLPGIIEAMDQPSCDGINTWFISKYARENGLKAVLSGIGGDELYGGYPSFNRMQKVNLLENIPRQLLNSGKYTGLKKLRRLGYLSLGGAVGKYLFLRGQFIPFEIARQLNIAEEQVWKILGEQPVCENIENLSSYNQSSWIELNMFMQNQLLRDVDVMSMAHGIEIRVPFLDKEFVDLSMHISDNVKSEGRFPKQLLIDTFKNMLPEATWNRPKMGFGFPFKKWLANDHFVQSIISPDSSDYKQFVSGNMHWSKFLSLALIKNRMQSTSYDVGVTETGNWKENGQKNLLSIKGTPHQEVRENNKEANKILFLTLRTFSVTGGIEKVSKVAGKALYELCRESRNELSVCSMYDEQSDADEKYFPAKNFTGFGIKRFKFTRQCVYKGIKNDTVILSHVNLLPVGYLIKLLSPKTKLLLITHGIEAWEPMTGLRKDMLFKCDKILSVSKYTKGVITKLNSFPEDKIQVINNCLDPFLDEPDKQEKNYHLLKRYGLQPEDIVLMTLTRLATRERYKGYDIVIESVQKLIETHPHLKYLIVGKYDNEEKSRLDNMIEESGLKDHVIFTGFVPDEELAGHFKLADIYIMPSEKEGFGIVFIEAMYYNKPVIAGNTDGSTDALLDGRLGLLVNPKSLEEVTVAITSMISNKAQYLPDRKLLMDNFSYPVYKEKWRKILKSLV